MNRQVNIINPVEGFKWVYIDQNLIKGQIYTLTLNNVSHLLNLESKSMCNTENTTKDKHQPVCEDITQYLLNCIEKI